MILLLSVFVLIAIWHIRPFNAGRPIVIAFTALVLILYLVNTDGLIAKYNTEQYLSGRTDKIDTEMLAWLSDAAVPYLEQLSDAAPDLSVRDAAKDALETHSTKWTNAMLSASELDTKPGKPIPFYAWDVQSARVAAGGSI